VARRKKGRSTVYIVSIGVHVLLAAAIALIPQKTMRHIVAIALAETEKPKENPKPPPPPPPRSEVRAARAAMAHAAAAETPAAEEAAAKGAEAFTDIGIALDSSSADGLAIRMAPATQATAAAKAAFAPASPKLLVAKSNEVPCTEELVKAVPLSRPSPKYTPEAENAGIEGKVRLELKVNDLGQVEDAKVLQGLGYGLDESAVETVKRWRFKPATLCGKPVTATFVVSVVFSGS
jgi:protein TonB